MANFNETCDNITTNLSKLRINFSLLTRQIETNSAKLKLIQDKSSSIKRKEELLIKYEKLKGVCKSELILAEHEMTRIERCLQMLKDIHIFRTSPDITKKIFHNMPIYTRNTSCIPPSNACSRSVSVASRAQSVPPGLGRVGSAPKKGKFGMFYTRVLPLLSGFGPITEID